MASVRQPSTSENTAVKQFCTEVRKRSTFFQSLRTGRSIAKLKFELGDMMALPGGGMQLEDVRVPPYLPDNEIVRGDICDYFLEVQRFDRDAGAAIAVVEKLNELDNTIIVMVSDNGASGAIYVFDRERELWHMLSFEGCEDQFTSEKFDRAFSEYDLFRLVEQPGLLLSEFQPATA